MTAEEVCASAGHNFSFKGLVYSRGKCSEGAYQRVYEDAFFCSRCLCRKYTNPRVIGWEHHAPLKESMPK